MNDQAMTTARAEELAREDYAAIDAAATGAVDNGAALPGERALLVDGSQYSPSWRALGGGAAVWEASRDGINERGQDTDTAYVETLDKLTDGYKGPSGEYLTWEEGCLFVSSAGSDD